MPDIGDDSVKLEEHAVKTALANHANRPREGFRPYTGFCHYCNEGLPNPKRFCDDDCKEDQLYEEERMAAQRSR